MKKWIFLALAFSSTSQAQDASALNSLTTKIIDLRSQCETIASDHRKNNALEEQKRRLDSRLGEQQLRNDVQLYSIGHGRQQTNTYMLDLLTSKAKAESEEAAKAIEVSRQRDSEVASCVSDSTSKGKAAFAEFKKSKRSSSDITAASELMTSWLVNVESITTQYPEGTVESFEAWKRARAGVELNSL
ncbi:hypothetical protein [Xanthomonas axonopodis]|uniref:hypothetical protein n=1 Tax=Xanthomonas axonopodis TaxID=53413 RepID=UPI0035560224